MNLSETQIDCLNRLKEKIKEKKTVVLLEGHSGCGKSYILKKLKLKGPYGILIRVNHGLFQRIGKFYDVFKSSISTNPFVNIKIMIFISKIITLIYIIKQSLFGEKEEISEFKEQLSTENYNLIFFIDKLLRIRLFLYKISKRSQKWFILIFDETNFIDRESMQLVKMMCNTQEICQVFPAFHQLIIVVAYTPEYFTSNQLNDIIRDIPNNNIVKLQNFSKSDLLSIAKLEQNKIAAGYFIKIRQVALGSNIGIALLVLDHLAKQKKPEDLTKNFIAPSLREFINRKMDKNFRKEEKLREILTLVAISNDSMFLHEIELMAKKLYSLEEGDTKYIVYRNVIKRFFRPSSYDGKGDKFTPISYRTRFYKNFYSQEAKKNKVTLLHTYADILGITRPGDYLERAKYYAECGEGQYQHLYETMEAVQLFYRGIACDIPDNEYKDYAKFMQTAYEYYYEDRFDEARKKLDEIDTSSLHWLLIFEIDYLRDKTRILDGNIKCLQIIRDENLLKLERFLNENSEYLERELFIRIQLLLYVIHIYLGENEQMKKRAEFIYSHANFLSRDHEKYSYIKYSLLRRSIMTKHVEIAVKDTRKSIDFFSEERCKESTYFIKERFYALINHVDNCRMSYQYEEALNTLKIAKKMYNKYTAILPKMVLYNAIPITYWENKKGHTLCLTKMYLENLISNLIVEETFDTSFLMVFNNIACLYMYNGLREKAWIMMKKCHIILNNIKNPVSSHEYIISINSAVIQFLNGNHLEANKYLENKCDNTYEYRDQFLRKRHGILKTIINSDMRFTTASEMNMYMEQHYSPSKWKCWEHYNTCLYLWGMQYWSK